MCLSSPKMPQPTAAPLPPPPPTEMAEVVKNKVDDKRRMKKRRGTSSLTISRNSVSTPTSGYGANVPS